MVSSGGERPLRLFISAGEVSGDQYGSGLVAALRAACAATGRALELRVLGGPRMAATGAQLLVDTTARGAVGFVDPLRHALPGLLGYARVWRWLRRWRPDVAVLIDYPGFNIPLARLLHDTLALPVVWYLPPEECLWGKRGNRRLDRAHRVAARSELVLTLHAQDTAFYQAQGCRVQRVGHPLLDRVDSVQLNRVEARRRVAPHHNGPLVALFPASRPLELRLLWPVFDEAAAYLAAQRSDLQFLLVAAAPHLHTALARALRQTVQNKPILAGRLHLLTDPPSGPTAADLAAVGADLALCKSGSVTLELALRGVPQVMVYRVDPLTEWLGRHLLALSERDFEFMALPNYLLQEPLVPEFKQHQADPRQIAHAALALLNLEAPARLSVLAGYQRLRRQLGAGGAASRAAEAILALAHEHRN